MTINFGSTYEISLKRSAQKTQATKKGKGITPAKKDTLKAFAVENGGQAPTYREGKVRFSVPKIKDDLVAEKLKKLKFLDFIIAPVHNVKDKNLLEGVIKEYGKKARIAGQEIVIQAKHHS